MAGLNRAYKRRPSMVAMNGGPVLCLDAGSKLSYPGSGTTWTDLSGNGNTGTLANGPIYDATNGGSFSFNGTNQYATVASTTAINPADQFTIDAWFNANAAAIVICSKYVGGGGGYLMHIREIAGSKYAAIDGRNGNASVAYFTLNTSTALTLGSWYNFTCTFNNITLTPYLNGVAVPFTYGAGGTGGVLNGSGTFVNSAPFYVGQVLSASYFNGKISCCKLYNRVLSATEISTNFNLLRGRYGI